jgi:rRNA maturation endonuclease Nob1
MKYIIDTHKITRELLMSKRDDLYTLEEVAQEFNPAKKGRNRIEKSNIKIVALAEKHLSMMSDLMKKHGDDTDLIDLAESKGEADVAILAYILAEIKHPDSLFEQNQPYTVISSDEGLKKYCKLYKIRVQENL